MKCLTLSVSMMVCCILFSTVLKGQVKKDSLKGKPLDTLVKPPAAIQLKEVVIKANPPVKINGDTVSYNARAFKTRVNSTVQDLLKKLPGLQVDPNGRLSFQGRGIEKIYINGKDYYLNDPKLITQDLTADMIERIEVFDNRSKQSQLSGIKDTNPAKAINLKLKEGVNLDFTGRVYGGYGSTEGYSIGAKGSSFVKSRAITGSLNSNNINDLTEENANPFSSYRRSASDRAALQYGDSWGKKLKASLSYKGSNRRQENRMSNTNRQAFLADSSLLENNSSETIGKNEMHDLKGAWEISIDSTRVLNLTSSLGLSSNNSNSLDALSGLITRRAGEIYTGSLGSTMNTGSSNMLNTSSRIRYDQKLKRRTLSVHISHAYMQSDMHGSFNSILQLYAPDGSLLESRRTDQRYTEINRNQEYAAGIATSQLLKAGQFLNAGYEYRQDADQIGKRRFNYNTLNDKYDLPDSLTTGNFSTGTFNHRANLGYGRNSKKINYRFGFVFEHNTLQNNDAYRNTRYRRGFTALLPSASVSYNSFNSKGNRRLSANYSSRSEQPNIYQLQPVTDNRNPMQLITGNPDLKQQFMHQLSLNYSNFKAKRMRDLNFGVAAGYEQHSIITATEILAGGVQKISHINMEGKYTLGSNAAYEIPLGKKQKGRLRFGFESQYENSPGLLNNSPLVLRYLNSEQRTEFWYRAWDKMELGAEARLSYNISRYLEKPDLNSSGLIQNYKLVLGYDLPYNMLLKSDYGLQLIGAQAGLAANAISVWNASLLKNILKNGRGELKVSAFDILNSNSGFFQRVAPGYIQQTSSNVLGRLVLLSFIYHLRKVPQDKEEG